MFARIARNNPADQAAIGLSALCMLHCLSLPLLISLLPALGVLQAYESWTHRGLLLLTVPVSAWALTRGCARHGHWSRVVGIGMLALVTLLAAMLLEPIVPGLALPLTVAGSLGLIASHVLNLRGLARCSGGSAGDV